MDTEKEMEKPAENEQALTEENAAEEVTEPTEEQKDEECRNRICPSCAVFAEANAVRLRSLAEMDNFKKRVQKEKEEQAKYASEKVLSDLLPTLDNLDLALQYASPECQAMMEGVRMTRVMLAEALKKHGLSEVGKEGEAFDPQSHEAVGMEKADDDKAGQILRVMQKGYVLNGRLLRPARVIVASK